MPCGREFPVQTRHKRLQVRTTRALTLIICHHRLHQSASRRAVALPGRWQTTAGPRKSPLRRPTLTGPTLTMSRQRKAESADSARCRRRQQASRHHRSVPRARPPANNAVRAGSTPTAFARRDAFWGCDKAAGWTTRAPMSASIGRGQAATSTVSMPRNLCRC